MGKKKIAGLFILIVICIFCVGFGFSPQQGALGRDKDLEFASGSGITIEQVSDLQMESLYKLCKVWGYAKYHHPSVVDGTLNWDAQLFRVMPKLLEAGTGEEANEILYVWLNSFAYETPVPGKTEEAWITLQKEAGFQSLDTAWIGNRELFGEKLCSSLERLSQTLLAERSNAYAAFDYTSPYVNFDNEMPMPVEQGDDGVKLLSLFRFWNAYEYYSPNIEITKKDWDLVLKESIPKLLAADDHRSYVLAIAGVAAETGDAHISVYDSERVIQNYYGKYSLSCRFKNVDGQVVVAYAPKDSGSQGLKPGDVILKIDGLPIEERIKELSQYTALSEPDKFALLLSRSLLKTDKAEVEVLVLRDGTEVTLKAAATQKGFQFKNPYKNGMLEQEQIGYIDPSALKKGDIEKLMKEFADTKGIIVDLRYYPSVFIPYLLGEYVTPEPKQFARMTFPNRAIPGSFFYSDECMSGAGVLAGTGQPGAYPPYGGKLVLLMDETTQSQPEFTIMALRQAPNSVVVGSPSIGSDGNVVKLTLPGTVEFYFTGLGVFTPEGEQTQRVGLKPDIVCYPTVEGLRNGRDELVEKAVEIILK